MTPIHFNECLIIIWITRIIWCRKSFFGSVIVFFYFFLTTLNHYVWFHLIILLILTHLFFLSSTNLAITIQSSTVASCIVILLILSFKPSISSSLHFNEIKRGAHCSQHKPLPEIAIVTSKKGNRFERNGRGEINNCDFERRDGNISTIQ